MDIRTTVKSERIIINLIIFYVKSFNTLKYIEEILRKFANCISGLQHVRNVLNEKMVLKGDFTVQGACYPKC